MAGRLSVSLLLLAASLAAALETEEARHLLSRAGFGATAGDAIALRGASREQAVRRLVAGGQGGRPAIEPPAWQALEPPDRRSLEPARFEAAQREYQEQLRERSRELQRWWFREMLQTGNPLTERMVLFWHNHFTSSLDKVRQPDLMLRQNQLFRRRALGSFATLLREVARDPAMLVYLDSQTNVKAKPNENFARELLELFTMGEGRYAEADVRETARCFTGWRADLRAGAFAFDPRLHDDGEKTILGRRGPWNGDEVIDIVLQRPEPARFVVEKLWREFVSPKPEPAEVERLATLFRDRDYEVAPVVEALLLSPAFWDPANGATLVKSPVELLVGTARLLGLGAERIDDLPRVARDLGQEILNPPTVKGWTGGTEWIDSRSLLLRRNALDALLGRSPPSSERIADLQAFASAADSTAGRLAGLLLPDPTEHQAATRAALAAALRQIVLDPAYQLK